MASVYKKMPNGKYITVEKEVPPSRYLQNARTGAMIGRLAKGESAPKNSNLIVRNDQTTVRRVKKDFTIVKGSKGRRGHVRRFRKGQILGRN